MHALDGWIATAATATPSPGPTVDPDLVTPGPVGFTVMALLALVVVLLVADMLRRVRRARYREEVGKDLDAEQAAAAAEQDGAGAAEGSADEASGSSSPEDPRPDAS